MSKMKMGGRKAGHPTGGTDAYKQHATKSAVDYTPKGSGTSIGGGIKTGSEASRKLSTKNMNPVPGYSPANIKNSAVDCGTGT